MLTVYGTKASGNCYKVQLVLEQLQRPYRWVEVDIFAGESRTPQYLAMNPNGRVPLLEVEPGRWLAESNAILCYLGEGSPLWPHDAWTRAQALAVMERHLQQQAFFAGDAYSLADIALFAYTHAAEDGGFDLSSYAHIVEWMQRVRAQPGFVAQSC